MSEFPNPCPRGIHFFALWAVDFFGVEGDSGLLVVFYEYLPGRGSSGGFGLAVP